MKQIIIVNAYGFGLEVAEWITQMPGFGTSFDIKGYLDGRIAPTRTDILGTVDSYKPEADDCFVVALRQPAEKKRIVEELLQKGSKFFNVIHPSSQVSPTAVFGEGIICAPFNLISTTAIVGNYVTLYGFVRIGHHTEIGAYCHLSAFSNIYGFAKLPAGSLLEPFHTFQHD